MKGETKAYSFADVIELFARKSFNSEKDQDVSSYRKGGETYASDDSCVPCPKKRTAHMVTPAKSGRHIVPARLPENRVEPIGLSKR